jgi:hypothetical protein
MIIFLENICSTKKTKRSCVIAYLDDKDGHISVHFIVIYSCKESHLNQFQCHTYDIAAEVKVSPTHCAHDHDCRLHAGDVMRRYLGQLVA